MLLQRLVWPYKLSFDSKLQGQKQYVKAYLEKKNNRLAVFLRGDFQMKSTKLKCLNTMMITSTADTIHGPARNC